MYKAHVCRNKLLIQSLLKPESHSNYQTGSNQLTEKLRAMKIYGRPEKLINLMIKAI